MLKSQLTRRDAPRGVLRGQLTDANRTIENHVRTIGILAAGVAHRDEKIKTTEGHLENYILLANKLVAENAEFRAQINLQADTIHSLTTQLHSCQESIRLDGTTCEKCGGEFTGTECDCEPEIVPSSASGNLRESAPAQRDADEYSQPDAPDEADPGYVVPPAGGPSAVLHPAFRN